MQDLSNYDKLRENANNLYSKVGKVFCPALEDNVYFTAEGFNHLIYKRRRSEREKDVQMLRFKILPWAIKLVKVTSTFQEYDETLKEVEVKQKKKRVKVTKLVKYWGLIAIIEGRKIKVIIRQVGESNKHFLSVIPGWQTNVYRDTKYNSTMKGNPEED